MNIQVIPIQEIKTSEYNPRIVKNEEYQGLKNSLKLFGQQENLIINKDGTLISGHVRLQASKELGWTEMTCNVVDLDKKQEKKLNVVMNNRAIQGSFDELKLAEILEELKLDSDYGDLRLDVLEPLDLSDIQFDGVGMSTEEAYKNQAIKQIMLAYSAEEFAEVMLNINAVIASGKFGANPSEVFANVMRRLGNGDALFK